MFISLQNTSKHLRNVSFLDNGSPFKFIKMVFILFLVLGELFTNHGCLQVLTLVDSVLG